MVWNCLQMVHAALAHLISCDNCGHHRFNHHGCVMSTFLSRGLVVITFSWQCPLSNVMYVIACPERFMPLTRDYCRSTCHATGMTLPSHHVGKAGIAGRPRHNHVSAQRPYITPLPLMGQHVRVLVGGKVWVGLAVEEQGTMCTMIRRRNQLSRPCHKLSRQPQSVFVTNVFVLFRKHDVRHFQLFLYFFTGGVFIYSRT